MPWAFKTLSIASSFAVENHIIKILPVINAGTLNARKSTDYRVEGGLQN